MAVRATQALRQKWVDEASDKLLCSAGCGHRQALHRERPRELQEVVGMQIVCRTNPDYLGQLHFHCTADGCFCVKSISGDSDCLTESCPCTTATVR